MHASAKADDTIMTLAARQHGLVTRAQLLEAGVAADGVKYRVRVKRLRLMQRGVYRVGPLVSPNAREMASVLACSPDAYVSHRGAAVLWQLLTYSAGVVLIDITVRRHDRGRRPGIRAHRAFSLADNDVTQLNDIPLTTPARTLVDLAGTVSPRELEQALAQAERRQLVTASGLASLVARHRGRRGMRLLRALITSNTMPALSRSEAEARFLTQVRRMQLPMPETNVRVHEFEVDFLWKAERLVVEIDGFAYHSSPGMFESDRRRDALLAARGMRVIRVTWHQIVREPDATVMRIGQALARGW